MRHKVVHDYLGVDEDIVWQVVTDDLRKLLPEGHFEFQIPCEFIWSI